MASCTGTSWVCLTCWMACHSLSFYVLFHTPFVLLFPPSHTHFNTSRVLSQSLSSFSAPLVWRFALLLLFLSSSQLGYPPYRTCSRLCSVFFFSHFGLVPVVRSSRVLACSYLISTLLLIWLSLAVPLNICARFASLLRTLFLCMLPASSAFPFCWPANAV